MNRIVATAALCAVLAGCASTRPAPEITLDEPVAEAVPMPEPPVPVQVVEVPTPLPLPGQLKPLSAKARMVSVDPAGDVTTANVSARIEPVQDGFVNAMQVWPYSAGALYQVYASPGRVTDIALQPGEELVSVSAGDTVRWIIGDTVSGRGAEERVHVLVKPSRADLKTNLVISTDRRSYHLELSATPETWMASVAWEYPDELVRTLHSRSTAANDPVVEGVVLEQLRFRYTITGDAPAWRPLRAFDDGRKVYIQFPQNIGQGELPPLFVIGAEGDTQLVNYRVQASYLIVDRLFGAAELRLGGERQQVVRIERTDGRTRRR
ncbi:P-type conjugative transfer protein TrbG [Luteimonas saliphila]|uniref:P-type conjugative transfer protein TrbG n=1 Tax=Luteimonas saliphila TaxID=2804919 RepID=UPI00192DD40B|nr:P-type conjugative transfer protein TrbG [Luteimonas saliphila]